MLAKNESNFRFKCPTFSPSQPKETPTPKDLPQNHQFPPQFQTIEEKDLSALNLSFPHTTHCLADGNIMISTLGDSKGDNRGNPFHHIL
jgi:hypothetical protein